MTEKKLKHGIPDTRLLQEFDRAAWKMRAKSLGLYDAYRGELLRQSRLKIEKHLGRPTCFGIKGMWIDVVWAHEPGEQVGSPPRTDTFEISNVKMWHEHELTEEQSESLFFGDAIPTIFGRRILISGRPSVHVLPVISIKFLHQVSVSKRKRPKRRAPKRKSKEAKK